MRILIVTRHYWPWHDEAGRNWSHLAAELKDRGHWITVLTPLDYPDWPAKLIGRGARIERIENRPHDHRSEKRFLKSLATWLKRNSHRFDLIAVSGFAADAAVVVHTLHGVLPIVPSLLNPNDLVEITGRQRAQCLQADAAIVAGPQTAEALVAQQFPPERITPIPPGVPLPPPRTKTARHEARMALAAIGPNFETSPKDRLAVYCGPLTEERQLDRLVAAFRPIARKWSGTRLWLIGEGPQHEAIRQHIDAIGLVGRVRIMGQFDQLDTILAAADLLVDPSSTPSPLLVSLEAMAAGLPVVACRPTADRTWLEAGTNCLLVPSDETSDLSEAIGSLLENRKQADQLGDAGRKRVENDFSAAHMADRYEALFAELLGLPIRTRRIASHNTNPSGIENS